MTVSLEPFKRAITRIMDERGQLHGMGVLVSPGRVLTCAHVVSHALGVDRDGTNAPRGLVRVNLPFEQPESVSASVLPDNGWYPPSSETSLDLALLQLSVPLIQSGHRQISQASSLFGQRFVAWVAQEGHEHNLIPISGRLERQVANGRYVVNVRESNYKIRQGCSGAPVVDPTSGLMLGLIVQEELDAKAEAGFLIPASQLLRVLRPLDLAAHTGEEPRLDTVRSWAKSRYAFRPRLRAHVLRFIAQYQDRVGEPKPFAGRAGLLLQLDQWLTQRERRFRILSGAIGRGKSALLLHWLARVIPLAEKLTVLYLPLSIRFKTADEATGVQLLFAAFCDAFSELKESFPQQPHLEDYLDRIALAWDHIAGNPEGRFLLVVDGLDEAADQWFLERSILPPELPPNLHVLISARHKPEQETGAGWLRHFASRITDSPGPAGTALIPTLLEVTNLDSDSMAEAVVQLGHPLDQLAERQYFVDALYRLTDQGDPLLLTLWLGQIWRNRDRVPDLDTEALSALRPSFQGFFERWMEEQQSVWEGLGLDIHPEDFGQVMQILSVAQGPMMLADLRIVLRRLKDAVRWEHTKLRAALESAHRLVTGDAVRDGYVLVHPRLAQYFQDQWAASPARVRAVRTAFRAWGARTVAELNSGKLSVDDCPRYLLDHYVAVHIDVEEADDGNDLAQYYLPLLQKGWPLAWYAYEGSWQGYLSDLSRVLQALNKFNLCCARNGRMAELRLAAEVRCALISASIVSMTRKIPSSLIVSLTKEGIWSLARSARIAMMVEASRQARLLLEIAMVAVKRGEQSEAESLLQQGLDAAATIADEGRRAEAVVALAARVRGQDELLRQALDVANSIRRAELRANALIAVVAQLSEENVLLHRAIDAARAIPNPKWRARVLLEIAALLPGDSALLQQILQDGGQSGDEVWCSVATVVKLSAGLKTDRPGTLWRPIWSAAEAIRDAELSAEALIVAAAQVRGEPKHTTLLQVASIAAEFQAGHRRARFMTSLVHQLHQLHRKSRSTIVQHALKVAAGFQYGDRGTQLLVDMASKGVGESRRKLLRRAVEIAAGVSYEDERVDALISVVRHLRGERDLLEQILRATRTIEDEERRTKVLIAAFPLLQGDRSLLERWLAAASAMRREELRANALIGLSPQLVDQQELLQRALDIARKIRDEEHCADALTAVAAQLPRDLRRSVLQQELEATTAIRDEHHVARTLRALAAQLQGDVRETVLQQALEVGTKIEDEGSRAGLSIEVAAQLHGAARRTVLRRVLDVVRTNMDERLGTRVLVKMTEQLQGEESLLQEVFEAATAIRDNECGGQVLVELASRSQGEFKSAVLRQALEIGGAGDERTQAHVISRVAAQLDGESPLLLRTFEAAAAIMDEDGRAEALIAVMARLRGDRALLGKALDEATSMGRDYWYALALSTVAKRLEDASKHPILQKALKAAQRIKGKVSGVRALIAVGAQLEGQDKYWALEQAMDVAVGIKYDDERAVALSLIARELESGSSLLPQVLARVTGIDDDFSRVGALIAVASRLKGQEKRDTLRQALEAVAAICVPKQHADALIALAAQLRGDQRLLQEALEAAVVIQEEEWRVRALRELLAEAKGYPLLQAFALKAVLAFSGCEEERLAITAARTVQNAHLLTYQVLFGALAHTRLSREEFLRVMEDYARLSIELVGGPEEAEGMARAVYEVWQWWN